MSAFSKTLYLVTLAATIPVFAACGEVSTAPHPKRVRPERSRPDRVAGEYLFQVRPGVSGETLVKILRQYEPELRRATGRNWFLVYLNRDPGLERLSQWLKSESRLVAVEPNGLYYTQ